MTTTRPRHVRDGVPQAGHRPSMWRVWARGRGFERVQWLHGPCGRPEQWMLQPEAVCLVDGGACTFVWVGETSPGPFPDLSWTFPRRLHLRVGRARRVGGG